MFDKINKLVLCGEISEKGAENSAANFLYFHDRDQLHVYLNGYDYDRNTHWWDDERFNGQDHVMISDERGYAGVVVKNLFGSGPRPQTFQQIQFRVFIWANLLFRPEGKQ